MKIQPLNDRIVVKADETPNQTEKGVYLPEGAKEKPQTGKVVSIGPGLYEDGERVSLTVQVGDTVLFPKYSGIEFSMNGLKYIILRESEILGVLK
jgi:chaperonin GroES